MSEYTGDPARRERMLDELLAAVRARRLKRVTVKVAGCVAAVALSLGGAAMFARGRGSPIPPSPVVVAAIPRAEAPEAPYARVQLVSNSPGIVERSEPRGAVNVEIIDDATLLTALMPRCGDVGLARIGERVLVYGGCPELTPPSAAQ
ncbi:MAG: hypothetical protein ACOYN0_07000 [Phycisphaerales bacterium]